MPRYRNVANWQGLTQGIERFTQGLAERKKQQQAFMQELQLYLLKQQLDPEAQLMNWVMRQGGQAGQPQGQGVIPQSGMTEQPSGDIPQFNINREQLLRGMLSKKFGVPYEQMMSPEEIQQQTQRKVQEIKQTELAKGIPTAEVGKAALARESLQNIRDVKNMLFPK